MAIEKLLVANRGEIAARIFRACREAGTATVAVAAPDDRGAFHTRHAEETVEIESYLAPEEHVRAAQQSGADAIHPGYGFLAENADFAEAVESAGLVFVGPTPEALRRGGDKLEAKQIAVEAGVPTLPAGEPGEVGFPLVVKAAAGGGGRGMRVVRDPAELEDAVDAIRSNDPTAGVAKIVTGLAAWLFRESEKPPVVSLEAGRDLQFFVDDHRTEARSVLHRMRAD